MPQSVKAAIHSATNPTATPITNPFFMRRPCSQQVLAAEGKEDHTHDDEDDRVRG